MTRSDIEKLMQEAGLKTPARGDFIFIHWDQIAMLLAYEREKHITDLTKAHEEAFQSYVVQAKADRELEALAARLDEREACAKACEEIEQDRWNLYKGRPPYTGSESGRADPHEQGVSMGAGECAAAIRARGEK